MNKYSYNTPIGEIYIGETEGKICYVKRCDIQGNYRQTPIIKETYRQLEQYFNGYRKTFEIPLHLEGTEFQKKVWEALTKIPYGETITYKQLAIQTGNPNAQRAVGMANHRNNILIIVPCHRVIGSTGKLTGYAEGLDIKKFLLDLEQNNR